MIFAGPDMTSGSGDAVDRHAPRHPGSDPDVSVYAESDTEVLAPGVRFVVVGFSHRTAPLAVRSRFSVAKDDLPVLARSFGALPGIRGCVVLATCNRLEAYLAIRSEAEAEAAFVDLVGGRDLEARAQLARSLMVHSGEGAVRYLFRVASGLDAMVLGDAQILGQVKETYRTACATGQADPILHKVFHAAFRCAKEVRTATNLGDGASSVAGAAMTLLSKRCGGLRNRSAVVVGVNEMTRLAAGRLAKSRVGSLVVCNRSEERGREMAAEFGVEAVAWPDLMPAVLAADLVITCTGATDAVFDRAKLHEAAARRNGRNLYVVDMAVPPDVSAPSGATDSAAKDALADPAAGSRLVVLDLEDVGTFQKEIEERRCGAASSGERIVDGQVRAFAAWLGNQRLGPRMSRLRDETRQSLEKELRRRYGDGESEERRRMEEFGLTMIKRFLGDYRRIED